MGQACTITLKQKERDSEKFTTFLFHTENSEEKNFLFDFNEKNYIVLISTKKDIDVNYFSNQNFKHDFMFLGWLVPLKKGDDNHEPILIKT